MYRVAVALDTLMIEMGANLTHCVTTIEIEILGIL